MHTFFVNTELELFDADIVCKLLFNNLRQSNQLICMNRGIDELSACARDISDLIDKDIDITDEFNVIVYVNVKERKDQLAAALVYEKIALMAVNENLASVLHNHGKTAKHIRIVLGEVFDRENELLDNDAFLAEMRKLLWERIGMPNVDSIYKMIDNIKARRPQSKCNAIAWLMEEFTKLLKDDEKESLIGHESNLFRTIINAFIEVIADKVTGEYDIELYEILENAFTIVCDEQKKRYTDMLSSKELRIDDADDHKFNRSAYQLYLYVYRCAVFEEIFDTIPQIQWDAFAQILAKRIEIMKKEQEQVKEIDIPFPFLDIDAIGGLETGFKNDSAGIYPIDEDIPNFMVDCELRKSMSVVKLHATCDAVIKDIQKKNKENEDKLDRFVRQVTQKFNDHKTEVFQKKRSEYRMVSKNISDIEQSIIDVTKWKKETDGFIAGQKHLSTIYVDFNEQIENTKTKIENYLISINRSRFIWIIFGAVLLVFLIPYLVIQYRDFTYSYSGLMFVLSMCVVIFAFWISYVYYVFKYKRLVIEVLKKLRDDFNNSQRQNEESAKTYKQCLTHYIPRSVILQQYYNELIKFEKDKGMLRQLYLYHKNSLQEFEDYMENLLRNLDIGIATTDTDDDKTYQYLLNTKSIHEDVTAITRLYSIVDKDNINSILLEGV